MDCSTPDFPVHHQLQEPTQTHVNPVGDAIKPSQPLSSPLPPPSIFSSTRVFSNESVLQIRWTKNWSFSFSITSSNQYSELISFRIDRLNLLEVQGTLKSLLQHHSSKASILWCYAFFIVQLSHSYMTTEKKKQHIALLVKQCLCLSTRCIGCSKLFFQGARVGPDAMILFFWMLSFKTTFSFFSFPLIKRL